MQSPHQAQILVPSLNDSDTMDFPILFLENQPKSQLNQLKSQQQQHKESNFQQIRNLNLIPIKIVETLNFGLSKLNHILDFCQYLQQTKQLKKNRVRDKGNTHKRTKVLELYSNSGAWSTKKSRSSWSSWSFPRP